MDVRPPIKESFEHNVVDAFCVKGSINMSIELGLAIEFKGDLNSFTLKKDLIVYL